MDRYLGLDTHAQSGTLGVRGPSGKRLQCMVVETNGRTLVKRSGASRGGFTSAWKRAS